ncbi:MAG: hypothetical protein KGL93_10935 [Gemmatimonadota bacterium]|nr:hypothetical protein [Gemmatimonadota bacterium]
MLINLLPDFFAVLDSTDPLAAYQRYLASHRRLLDGYWNNYVIPPDGPHFLDIVRGVVSADRSDLRSMLERTDVVTLARQVEERCARAFKADVDFDIVLMVGVGGANAGELVVDHRGIAFVCLEHFTGVANPETFGLGLDPELIPLWLAHEVAHVVRYTSPTSRAEMRGVVDDAGYYSYWDTARVVPLRELLVNEGLAVHASQLVSPGHAVWEYFGYVRRQYARVREMEPVINQAIEADLDRSALGLRLRYLSDGMSDDARMSGRHVLPERSGYYVGARMVAGAVERRGLPWALRASASEILALANGAAASAS